MLTTEKVVSILKKAGLIAKRSDREHTRPGFAVRKINDHTVGVLFDSLGEQGGHASAIAQRALNLEALATTVQPDGQTLRVTYMLPRHAGMVGVYLYSEKYGMPRQGQEVDYYAPKTGEKRQAVVDEVIPQGGHADTFEACICLVDVDNGQEVEMILRPDPRG